MPDFSQSDLFHLRSAVRWIGLGDYSEANRELEHVSPAMMVRTPFLEIRYQIYAHDSKWDACRDTALALTKDNPGDPSAWLRYACAARRATGGGVAAAWEILRGVAEKFPREPIVAYNLACYACQLGQNKEALRWLEKAFDNGDAKKLRLLALDEKDLEPLRLEIAGI